MGRKINDPAVSLKAVAHADDLIPGFNSETNEDCVFKKDGIVTGVSHTVLADKGTNTHTQIDTFIGTKAQASGLASLDGGSKVVQDPANATATPTASKIPIADGSGKLDGWITVAKDIVTTAPLTVNGGANLDNVLPGADADVTLALTQNLPGINKHLIFTIVDPLSVQTEDNEICLWAKTPAALTITNLEVSLDASANEVAGDLKYADTFIGLANPAVINDFDTTSGVRSDSSITSGSVPSGKAIYLSFDSAPNTAIHQMNVDITFDFD